MFFGRVVASWQHTDVYERLSYEKSQPDRELLVKPSNVYVTDMLHAMYFGHIIFVIQNIVWSIFEFCSLKTLSSKPHWSRR